MGYKQFKERVFRSGMEPALRRTAWKFLLGVFPPDSSFADRQRLLADKRQQYLGLKQQWTSITDQQAARCVLLVACGAEQQQCALHTSIAWQRKGSLAAGCHAVWEAMVTAGAGHGCMQGVELLQASCGSTCSAVQHDQHSRHSCLLGSTCSCQQTASDVL